MVGQVRLGEVDGGQPQGHRGTDGGELRVQFHAAGPPGGVPVQDNHDAGVAELLDQVIREGAAALGVCGGHQPEPLGGVDILLPLDDPHLHPGADCLGDLGCPVQHGHEPGRCAAVPAGTDEELLELLVAVPVGGALLADHLLHELAGAVDVPVPVHLVPNVLDVLHRGGDPGDGTRKRAELAAALPGPPPRGAFADPVQAPVAFREWFVEQVGHGQAESLDNLLGVGLAAVAVEQHSPTALPAPPGDVQRGGVVGVHRAAGHEAVEPVVLDGQPLGLECLQDPVQ